jgi:hypothetical protein
MAGTGLGSSEGVRFQLELEAGKGHATVDEVEEVLLVDARGMY